MEAFGLHPTREVDCVTFRVEDSEALALDSHFPWEVGTVLSPHVAGQRGEGGKEGLPRNPVEHLDDPVSVEVLLHAARGAEDRGLLSQDAAHPREDEVRVLSVAATGEEIRHALLGLLLHCGHQGRLHYFLLGLIRQGHTLLRLACQSGLTRILGSRFDLN